MQVKRFVQETKEAARARGFITTLGGRHRPIKALPGRGLSAQQAAAEADRKAVNSTIQGSAADLIKLAMTAWSKWQHAQLQPGSHLHATQKANSAFCKVTGTLVEDTCIVQKPAVCLQERCHANITVICIVTMHHVGYSELQETNSLAINECRGLQCCASCGSDP